MCVVMNNFRSSSILPQRLLGAIRVALCAAAFLGFANSLRAGDHLYYDFANAASSSDTERSVTISLVVSARDDGTYSAVYSHREWIHETLTDVKAVTFERSRVLTAGDGAAFFANLVDAGLWSLPEGDNSTGDALNTQLYARISGRDLQRTYFSRIEGGPREAFHAAVIAFAKKLGVDQPEDAAKATHIVEGDRTPAREIPFSSLITNPARYDGKRIAVVGFYHCEFECSLLVPGKFDWHGLDSDREFWIDSSSKYAKESDFRWKNDSWVRIEGVFNAGHGGHMGGSPGVIGRLTKFTTLDGPPKPAAADALGEDDPHGLEKLTLELQIQPFPMDGRPIQEVVAALNRQIAAQLTRRGLPDDWLKLELDPSSNLKARVERQIEYSEPLRDVVGLLGGRVSPGENLPFGGEASTYTYILPNVIQLHVRTSPYPDDKEPISFHEDTLGKHAVRAKLVRYAANWGGPETFRVQWHSDMNPEELRISEALALIHRTLPDEPGAKSVTRIAIQRVGAGWEWTTQTDSAQAMTSSAGGVTRTDAEARGFFSLISTFGKRQYVAWVDAKTVITAPKWNFTGRPPLELDAAIRAAREALGEIPNAEVSLQLEEISLAPLDLSRCAYQITFRDPAAINENFLTIPVLLSGKAVAPKLYPNSKDKE